MTEALDAAKTHAEPITIMLGGKEYQMSRIQGRDIGAAAQRLRDRRVQAVIRNVAGLQTDIIGRAIAYAGCVDPTDREVWAYFDSAEGIAYMYWRCLQRHNRQLTEAKVAELLDNEPEMRGLLFAESGLATPSAAADEDEDGSDFPTFASKPQSDGTKEPGT